MPIYEYACRCGERFEELVRTGTTVACPQCGSRELDRLVSGFVAATRPRRPRSQLEHVPFERAHSCGGSCGHRH